MCYKQRKMSKIPILINSPIGLIRNFLQYSWFIRFVCRLFFERDQILQNVQEIMRSFDNDVSLLYYLRVIKALRVKETDLR